MLASGLTDLKIAEKLVLSPRTVHTHISSIYVKLGVTSRSAATRYAIEHHLTQLSPHQQFCLHNLCAMMAAKYTILSIHVRSW